MIFTRDVGHAHVGRWCTSDQLSQPPLSSLPCASAVPPCTLSQEAEVGVSEQHTLNTTCMHMYCTMKVEKVYLLVTPQL